MQSSQMLFLIFILNVIIVQTRVLCVSANWNFCLSRIYESGGRTSAADWDLAKDVLAFMEVEIDQSQDEKEEQASVDFLDIVKLNSLQKKKKRKERKMFRYLKTMNFTSLSLSKQIM